MKHKWYDEWSVELTSKGGLKVKLPYSYSDSHIVKFRSIKKDARIKWLAMALDSALTNKDLKEYLKSRIESCWQCDRILEDGGTVVSALKQHDDCHGWVHCGDECCGRCSICGS